MTKRNKQGIFEIVPFLDNSNIYKAYCEGKRGGENPYSSITDPNRRHWFFRGQRDAGKI